jgi:exosortase
MELNPRSRPLPWPALLGLAGLWLVLIRLFGPQWSLYEQYNYGWAVPFLCLYLLWRRWEDRPHARVAHPAPAIAALALCALLLLPTRVIVEANPLWRVGSWGLAVEVVGITLCMIFLAGGRRWLRHFGFPVIFLLIAVPWPSQPETFITQKLMRINASIVVELLGALGIAAVQHGNVIEVVTGMVGIDEACSGIRSLQATLMIALFFGEYYRLRPIRRTWLVASGVGLAFVCNVARTFTLVAVASHSGLAEMNRWHDPTGVGILVACFTGLWLVALRLKRHSPPARSHSAEDSVAVILPKWIAIGLPLWVIAVEGGNAAWFGLREQADPNLTNWRVIWPIEKPGLREVEITPAVAAQLQTDEGRSMSWVGPDSTAWQMFSFRWGPAHNLKDRVRVQLARGHRPDICLPASGLTQVADYGIKEFDVAGFRMPFHSMLYEDRGIPLHVYFCIWEDGPEGTMSNLRENSANRLRAALDGSRSIKLRTLELAVWGYSNDNEADAALQRQLQESVEPLSLNSRINRK